MGIQKIVAALLIAAGVMALAYGGFSYTRETHRADLGSIHLAVDEKNHISIPVWAGVIAILVGGLLLLKRTDR